MFREQLKSCKNILVGQKFRTRKKVKIKKGFGLRKRGLIGLMTEHALVG